MNDKSINKDLGVFLLIALVFAIAVASLKIYDDQTSVLQNLGSKIISRYIQY